MGARGAVTVPCSSGLTVPKAGLGGGFGLRGAVFAVYLFSDVTGAVTAAAPGQPAPHGSAGGRHPHTSATAELLPGAWRCFLFV